MVESIQNKISVLAKLSLVFGCLGVVLFLFAIVPIAAIVLGIIALIDISKEEVKLKGRWLAIAGIVLGSVVIIEAAMPRYSGRSDYSRVEIAREDIKSNIAVALDLYNLDNGIFPTSSQGLEALKSKPTSLPIPTNWNGPYLHKKPLDPWGREYQYVCPGTHNTKDYDLYSQGSREKDKESWITNWE